MPDNQKASESVVEMEALVERIYTYWSENTIQRLPPKKFIWLTLDALPEFGYRLTKGDGSAGHR